jgi:hypothetical protein
MTKVRVLLDIGAGDMSFAKDFRSSNPKYKCLYFCGDKHFKGSWNGDSASAGIRKMFALYNAFNVPDTSLDIVTLNGFNPLSGLLRGIESELARTLKSGGVFFSAHPIGMHPRLSESLFTRVLFSEYGKGSVVDSVGFGKSGTFFPRWTCPLVLPNGVEVEYPASPTIRDRIKYMALQKIGFAPPAAGYMYRFSSVLPTVRVWVKR